MSKAAVSIQLTSRRPGSLKNYGGPTIDPPSLKESDIVAYQTNAVTIYADPRCMD
ncbi:hypothetical protein GCM10007870_21660 [Gluconobacter kondonii]|uniref:Uncharacterized protein n=1 Tax=Gluconobacter kondonii TaxID=941463 RepID=A0ABQ5WSS6_9PROT|nr:hypothetical protein AA3266_0372 [Gluconobacter kondonii NBRC 3266]GLQ66582.1 hypothetical protein GCM10007870_21660 [Gluconobacter kondonii]